MYAIIADGGRQYKVEEGQELEVDYRDVAKGDALTFDAVLAISDDVGIKLGKPTVDGATVTAEVLGPTKGEKIFVQKLRRRKNSRRRTGHRQWYTKVRVSSISTSEGPVSAPASVPVDEKPVDEKPVDEAPAPVQDAETPVQDDVAQAPGETSQAQED